MTTTKKAPARTLRVPTDNWASDHYSLLLYIETRNVDGSGTLDHNALRLDARKYPTRTRDGYQPGHTDLDILDELEQEGLVTRSTPRATAASLTDRGWTVAHAVRRARGLHCRDRAAQVEAMHTALKATA